MLNRIHSFHSQSAYQMFNLKTAILKTAQLTRKEKHQPQLSCIATSNLHGSSNIRHRTENWRELQGYPGVFSAFFSTISTACQFEPKRTHTWTIQTIPHRYSARRRPWETAGVGNKSPAFPDHLPTVFLTVLLSNTFRVHRNFVVPSQFTGRRIQLMIIYIYSGYIHIYISINEIFYSTGQIKIFHQPRFA